MKYTHTHTLTCAICTLARLYVCTYVSRRPNKRTTNVWVWVRVRVCVCLWTLYISHAMHVFEFNTTAIGLFTRVRAYFLHMCMCLYESGHIFCQFSHFIRSTFGATKEATTEMPSSNHDSISCAIFTTLLKRMTDRNFYVRMNGACVCVCAA